MPKQRRISRLDIKTNQGDAIRRLSGLTVLNVLVISFYLYFLCQCYCFISILPVSDMERYSGIFEVVRLAQAAVVCHFLTARPSTCWSHGYPSALAHWGNAGRSTSQGFGNLLAMYGRLAPFFMRQLAVGQVVATTLGPLAIMLGGLFAMIQTWLALTWGMAVS